MMDKDAYINELVEALKIMQRRLKAREEYAAGYRTGRVPERVFKELKKTEGAEELARIVIDKASEL